MYSEIFNSVKTKHELDLLMAEIVILKESIYETKVETFNDSLKKNVRDYIADMIRADLKKDNKITPQEYLDGLKQALEKIQIINITIAFEPTEETVEKVFEWVNQNIGEGIAIHFISKSAIVGGAIIEYRGKYHDYSLAKTLNALFDIKTEEIVNRLVNAS